MARMWLTYSSQSVFYRQDSYCRAASISFYWGESTVTDHNLGGLMDVIKAATIGTGLMVFPCVEITCDTSKIYPLVLVDLEKTK